MAGSLHVETFPAPPILNLKPREEAKEPEVPHSVVSSSSLILPSPTPPDPIPRQTVVEVAEEEITAPPRTFALSLRLSRMETVEDEEEATIQVDGAEVADAQPRQSAVRLQLSLVGADADEHEQPIAVSSVSTPSTSDDAGAALEGRWQLRVRDAGAELKRASFEVTTEGILRTKQFAIGKSGFQRTSPPGPSALPAAVAAATASSSASPSASPASLPPPADRPHLAISDATILEMGLLGRGAGGKVLKSIHKPSLTVVALKCIDVSDKAKRAQLLKELAELDTAYCPHIVAFYGAYYHDLTCTVKLGLEYMNRGSLQALVHEHGRLHELALTHVVKQALLGLLHLHSHRKLHRDIKPGNILVNHFGLAKLSDFGILAELNNSLAKCGTFVGTTIYMSPERLTSEAYSYPADVWSLGMSVITMATGAFPLSTDDGYWGLVMHFNTQPPPTLSDAFTPAFRDFVARMMVKEPAKRWAVQELLQHPWVVNGCEAEEALTYWPEGARMFEPDPAVVRRQREERTEKLRKWEEAEEKKRQRKGLRSRASVLKEERAAAAAGPSPSTAAAKTAGEDDESGGRVRHRRKAAITRFHPVGLLHLQAEAHVQNGKSSSRVKTGTKEGTKGGDALYGDGSDEEDGDGKGDGERGQSSGRTRALISDEPTALKAGLTARSRKALGGNTVISTATRPRKLSVVMSSSSEAAGSSAESGDRPTPLLPLTSPKRGSILHLSAPGPVAPDNNLVSPSRAARHNLKFVNGQLVQSSGLAPLQSAAAPSSSPPALPATSASHSKQPSAGAVLADGVHEAVSFPSLAPLGASVDASPWPSSAAAPKALVPLLPDAPVTRSRSHTTGSMTPDAPSTPSALTPPTSSPQQQPLSAGLPAVTRGSRQRSPSLPAVAALSSGASPLSSSPVQPSSPHTPTFDGQRRGLRGRRPSLPSGDSSAAVPSSRAVIKLPSLQTTMEGVVSPPTPTPAAVADVAERPPAGEKGLRRRISSISASLASSDLPPVTPLHFRTFSTSSPFTSPLLPLPLSPRSARALTLISQSELDDVHTVVQALLDRYRERELTENDTTERRDKDGAEGKRPFDVSEWPPSSSDGAPTRPSVVSQSPPQSERSGSDGPQSPSGSSTPQSAGSWAWPSWLPDEAALQEDLDRVADQLGIRAPIIAQALRKTLAAIATSG